MPLQKTFEPDPYSARAARSFVAEALPAECDPGDIVLAASELATNVIRHAHTPFTVRLTGDDRRVRLEVWDSSSLLPVIGDMSEEQRGLRMIEAIADDWGIEAAEEGKVIWAQFDLMKSRDSLAR